MAVHGLSMAEVDRYILRSDPAHPDNIKAEYERLMKGKPPSESDAVMESVSEKAGEPTVFLLGNLQHEDRVYLSDMAGGMEQTPTGSFRMTPKNNQKSSEAVRRALKGWENFTDQKGNQIEFKTAPGTGERGQPRSFVSPESMYALHLDIVRELSARILEINGVTGEIEKKLQAALLGESDPLSQDGPAELAATETKNTEAAESQV